MLVPRQLLLKLSALVLQAGTTAQATVTTLGGDDPDDAATAAHRLPGLSLSRAQPAMSPYQQQYMAAVEAEAKAASDAATPFVLAALEDPRFRAGLHACCPSVASLNSESLLQRFRDETAISEMTHSFDVDLSDSGGHMGGGVGGKNGNFLGDPPLAVYMNSSHFYNLWEVAYLNITSYEALHAEVGAEEGLFGFSRFTNCSNTSNSGGPKCVPASIEEAAQRPIYTVLNQRKVDVGCPMFGNIVVVFATEWVQDMTVIAPMDTGWWTSHCNTSKSNGGNHHSHICRSNTDAQSCNHSWGEHGSCGWNAESGQCAPFDTCRNSTTRTACANATVGNLGHGGQGQNDRCVWVRMPSNNMSCQHWGDIPCSERGQVYQTNATLCNAIKSYGNSCRFRNDSTGTGCFEWDCTKNGSVSQAACGTFAKDQPWCHWDAQSHSCSEHGGFNEMAVNCDVQGWSNASVDEYAFNVRQLGTLRHFDHVLLENALFWGNGSSYECPPSNKSSNPWDSSTCAGKVSWSANESIIVETILPLFERMFAPLGETPHINSNGAGGASWFHYSEANIAGRIPYPDGIKFVILTFPDFFGTGNVTEVRDWCVQWGWPLVWALGTNSASGNGFGGGDQKFAVDANDRVLDPIVLSKVGAGKNMSDSGTDAATLDKFEALWASVNSTRNEMLPSNLPSSSNFTSWWAQLKREMPSAVQLHTLRPGDCADVDKCLGTNRDGHCVCNVFK